MESTVDPITTAVETMKLDRRYVERCAMSQASLNVSKCNGQGTLSPETSASRGCSASSNAPTTG